MKLMVIILNRIDALESLLEGLSSVGVGGATIIESSGMAMTLSRLESSVLSASIRSLFSGDEDNRTIFSVIRDDQLDTVRKVVYKTVGDLSKPNTGILFTIPLDFVEGTKKGRKKPGDKPEAEAKPEPDKQAGEADKAEEKPEKTS
ncbi:hypothetical protein [Ruminococcus sp. NK3A76]|uniref:hypothetical protein n=1 Tax=Ruminococcus sp. NK3A76 TaxID=877411 RepID=UPI000A99776F|nr:hypothetical protein [Ruminococcus sp. NK3A76]